MAQNALISSSKFLGLTTIIETLENFQVFEPGIRAVAIALYASELNIAQIHFYAIALYASLGGAQ